MFIGLGDRRSTGGRVMRALNTKDLPWMSSGVGLGMVAFSSLFGFSFGFINCFGLLMDLLHFSHCRTDVET